MQVRKCLSDIVVYAEMREKQKKEEFLSPADKRAALSRTELTLANLFSSVLPEIDAFHEYKIRSKLDSLGSWDILAQMRHHSVPTRLLDWTECCYIAVHFALRRYLDAFVSRWSKENWMGDYPTFPDVSAFAEPAIWILNPFHLVDLSGIQGAIPYPNHLPLKDYYNSFLVDKDWPFHRPVPIRAPRSDLRMESQRGNFTVHGIDTRPIEQQLPAGKIRSVMASVRIPKIAAVYGAFFLWQFINSDTFELMRDMDSLGQVVSERHFGGQG